MKRGEIWTLQGSGYASKPRPVLVVQGSHIDDYGSLVVCLISSFDSGDSLRVRVEPNTENGLNKTSYIMVDKIYSTPKSEFGVRVGRVTSEEMDKVTALAALLELDNS